MSLIWRLLVGSWAVFFGQLGLRGLIDPGVYADILHVAIDAAGRNALRADLTAFFLVSSATALAAAIQPLRARWLLVPAGLFGTALAGRLIGALLGDDVAHGGAVAMVIEGASVVLLLAAARGLPRAQVTEMTVNNPS